jgi:hypothetical protein
MSNQGDIGAAYVKLEQSLKLKIWRECSEVKLAKRYLLPARRFAYYCKE